MKLLSKPTTIGEFVLFIALSASLLLFYFLFQHLGFDSSDSKGLSLLFLIIVIALYLAIERSWIKSCWDKRFNGLSTEQAINELNEVFEEQVKLGVVTRAELEEIREKAKVKYEKNNF